MKKVTNHKGCLTAILSIIPFFIFSAIFQGLGFVFTSLLGSRGVIDFDFDKYIESEGGLKDYLAADTIIRYFDLIGIFLLLWILIEYRKISKWL